MARHSRIHVWVTGKIEGKLKAKRRKFRLKTKNEISSLKRRISFISSGTPHPLLRVNVVADIIC